MHTIPQASICGALPAVATGHGHNSYGIRLACAGGQPPRQPSTAVWTVRWRPSHSSTPQIEVSTLSWSWKARSVEGLHLAVACTPRLFARRARDGLRRRAGASSCPPRWQRTGSRGFHRRGGVAWPWCLPRAGQWAELRWARHWAEGRWRRHWEWHWTQVPCAARNCTPRALRPSMAACRGGDACHRSGRSCRPEGLGAWERTM